jgi:hypothetical protein
MISKKELESGREWEREALLCEKEIEQQRRDLPTNCMCDFKRPPTYYKFIHNLIIKSIRRWSY